MNNYRGIFRVNILRSILYCLIFNDEYEVEGIYKNLTDSNVGGRKERNIREYICDQCSYKLNKIRKRGSM